MVPLLIVTKMCCSCRGWKSRRTRGPVPDGVPGSSCSRGRQVCLTVVLIKAFWTYKEIIIQGGRHKVRDVPICVTIRRGNCNDDDKSCCGDIAEALLFLFYACAKSALAF